MPILEIQSSKLADGRRCRTSSCRSSCLTLIVLPDRAVTSATRIPETSRQNVCYRLTLHGSAWWEQTWSWRGASMKKIAVKFLDNKMVYEAAELVKFDVICTSCSARRCRD